MSSFNASEAVEAILETLKQRPMLTLALTNAATAFGVLYVMSEGAPIRTLTRALFRTALAAVPKSIMDAETAKVKEQIEHSVIGTVMEGEERLTQLPAEGWSKDAIVAALDRYASKDAPRWSCGKVSGGVYHGGADVSEVMLAAFAKFALSNPLHPDLFPSVRKMEAEVVAMTLRLFNAPASGVGTMTSGGTESILMAMRAYREYARATRGVLDPEVVVPTTAHAAFDKACDYFRIKMVHVPVDPVTFRADPARIRAAINRNTIALVVSAPSYPQGVIDPVEEVGRIALEKNLPMHVDCCLGSFLIACAGDAGYPTRPFDFRVPGVTSISTDTHKFGFAPKGSSVVLYSRPEFRHAQYFVAPEWPGGTYASPTIAGSRAGAMIAGAWATMMYFGKQGYVQASRTILQSARRIADAVRASEHLTLYGEPDLSVVCFGTKAGSPVNIYHVADEMKERGWNLNILQHPACLHICVTYANAPRADEFIADVSASVATSLSAPKDKYKGGAAAIYGLAASIPDPSLVNTFAHAFLDALYKA